MEGLHVYSVLFIHTKKVSKIFLSSIIRGEW